MITYHQPLADIIADHMLSDDIRKSHVSLPSGFMLDDFPPNAFGNNFVFNDPKSLSVNYSDLSSVSAWIFDYTGNSSYA